MCIRAIYRSPFSTNLSPLFGSPGFILLQERNIRKVLIIWDISINILDIDRYHPQTREYQLLFLSYEMWTCANTRWSNAPMIWPGLFMYNYSISHHRVSSCGRVMIRGDDTPLWFDRSTMSTCAVLLIQKLIRIHKNILSVSSWCKTTI